MPLVRVLEITSPSGKFHFDGGEPQTFVEVDWFRDEQPDDPDWMQTEEGRTEIANFVKNKRYFDSTKAYLILHQDYSFTINYHAP